MKYYCPYCGAKIKKNDRKCYKCDTRFCETHNNQEIIDEIDRNPYGTCYEKPRSIPSINLDIVMKLVLVVLTVLLVVLIVVLLSVFGMPISWLLRHH